MNANELADKLQELDSKLHLIELFKSANMLRQQQAEIEALKQIIDANNLNQNIGQFVKPTNEPVAWMHKTIPSWVSTFIHPETEPNEWQPLYTYPVEEQEIKEAKYGITTKWDGITTYHETTEPIGKAQEQ